MNYLEVIAFRKRYPHCHLVALFTPKIGAKIIFPMVPMNRYDFHSKNYDYLIPEKDDVIVNDLKRINESPSRMSGFQTFDEETHWSYIELLAKKIESRIHLKIS